MSTYGRRAIRNYNNVIIFNDLKYIRVGTKVAIFLTPGIKHLLVSGKENHQE